MNLTRSLFFSFAAVMVLLATPAHGQTLLGNGFDGVLYNVDFTTGNASNPRSTGTGDSSLTGIAISSNGTLYGLTTFVGNPANSLVTIDPVTGMSTTIGSTGLTTIAEGGLAFDPTNGTLFGIQNIPSNRELFTLDISTGSATVIGNLGGLLDGDFSSMAFAPDGTLYILDTGQMSMSRLLTVDKSTAATISSVTLSMDLGFTSGMAFHPVTGTLYVADGGVGEGTDSLYTLDPLSGDLTLVGPTGLPDGLAGLAFVIPEPNSAVLGCAAGMIALAVRRRSRCHLL